MLYSKNLNGSSFTFPRNLFFYFSEESFYSSQLPNESFLLLPGNPFFTFPGNLFFYSFQESFLLLFPGTFSFTLAGNVFTLPRNLFFYLFQKAFLSNILGTSVVARSLIYFIRCAYLEYNYKKVNMSQK